MKKQYLVSYMFFGSLSALALMLLVWKGSGFEASVISGIMILVITVLAIRYDQENPREKNELFNRLISYAGKYEINFQL